MTVPLDGGSPLYAFTLGLAAALNPCGFPLLPAYLSLFSGGAEGRTDPVMPRVARALLSGAGVTVGFILVFGALGLLIETGAQIVTEWLPWAMAAVGLALAAAGALTLAGRPPRLPLPVPGVAAGRSLTAMASYGATYAVGSLTCSLPLFLASVGNAFLRRGFLNGFSTYLAYALGMGLFVTAAAVVSCTAGAVMLRRFRSAGRWLPALSGIVLFLSGAYLAFYWVSGLVSPAAGPATAAANGLPQAAVALIGAHPLGTAAALGTLVVASYVLVAYRSLASSRRRAR